MNEKVWIIDTSLHIIILTIFVVRKIYCYYIIIIVSTLDNEYYRNTPSESGSGLNGYMCSKVLLVLYADNELRGGLYFLYKGISFWYFFYVFLLLEFLQNTFCDFTLMYRTVVNPGNQRFLMLIFLIFFSTCYNIVLL